MLNTYLNDNQGMAYPFYGGGSLPFPMSVITGLSICIQDDADTHQPLYVGSVMIDATSVRLAILRHLSDDPDDSAAELIGMFYANMDGFYTYIPSYLTDAVYEDQTITPQMLRFVYADYAPVQGSTVSGDSVIYNTELDDIIENMQVFYSFVQANVGVILGKTTSHGHIQLGAIPESAIGSYFGEFYLDPSCVVYMPDSVYGYHSAYKVNNDTYAATQAIELRASGLLTLSVNGSTVAFDTVLGANESDLIDFEFSTRSRITGLNGHSIEAIDYEGQYYPEITFKDNYMISWRCVAETSDNLIIGVNGNDTFPNCYGDD